GHMPLRATPDGTASELATNLLGWDFAHVQTDVQDQGGGHAVVTISNQTLRKDLPPITVELRQLGKTGPGGIWSVVGASNMQVDPVVFGPTDPGVAHVSGSVPGPVGGAPAIEADVFDGPSPEPSLGSARSDLAGVTFGFSIDVSPTSDGSAALFLT